MSFTITKRLEQLPSYSALCKLAVENQISVVGDEHTGSFSGQGLQGDYQFGERSMKGKFSSHGVRVEFGIENGEAAVSVIEKPFWLPESLLKRKIEDGLDILGRL
jgi:hypothetical protein